MSIASTTVFLYVGFDEERRRTFGKNWPDHLDGHIGVVDWLEGWAEKLETLYDIEFSKLNLSCVFDYEITEELGAWLYQNTDADSTRFEQEARRLVAAVQAEDDKRAALLAENDKRLEDKHA